MIKKDTLIDKFLLWGIPLLYFLITISFYLKTYDSCQIKITELHIGGTILLAAWLVRIFNQRASPFPGQMNVIAPVLALLVSGVVSFLHSPFLGASFMEVIRRIFYVVLALMIMYEFDTEPKIKLLLNFVIAACTISCVYGVIQFIDIHFYPGPPEPGLDPFIWRMAFYPRVFSTHGNPNFFADFLVVMSPIILALIVKTRSKFLMGLFILVSFNVAVTISKAAWIGYTAGVVAFAFLFISYFVHAKKANIRKIVITAVIILLIACIVAVWYYVKQRTDSVKFRVYTWMSNWEMTIKRPWLGTGIGTFYVVYPLYRRPQIFYVEGRHNTETDHPENEHIEVWYDEGLIGVGIWIWIIATFIALGLNYLKQFSQVTVESRAGPAAKKKKPEIDPRAYYMLGVLSSFIGMLSHNFMCVSLRFVSSGIFLGFLLGLIGTLVIYGKKSLETQKESAAQPKPVLWQRLLQGTTIIGALYLIKVFSGIFIADMEHNLAIFFSKRAQWNEALTHYNNVKRYNPYFIMAHYFMGNVFNDRLIMERSHHPEWGDREVTKPVYEQLVKKYVHDIELGNREFRHNPVTDLYEEYRNDPQRAVDKYDDVKSIAPNYVQVHHQTGLLYMKLGDQARAQGDMPRAQEYYQKSLENFGKYRAIDPIFAQNYVRIAYVYLQLGDLKKAEQTYRDHINSHLICKQGPHNIMWEDWSPRRLNEYAESAVNLGNILYYQGRLTESEESYKKAIELSPQSIQSWRNLAILYGRTQRLRDAANAWDKVLQLNPNDQDAQRAVGELRNRI